MQNFKLYKIYHINPLLKTSLIIDKHSTIVIQKQEINSFLPLSTMIYKYLIENKISNEWSHILGISLNASLSQWPLLHPKYGPLLPIWREIAQIFGSYLGQKTNSKNPTILLRHDGLSGSGCKTAICAAARALCINSLVINTADFAVF